jgi:hypothetical protein
MTFPTAAPAHEKTENAQESHSVMHRSQDRMSLSHAQESQESHSVMHRSHRMSLSHAQESRQHVTQPCTGFKTACHSAMHRSHDKTENAQESQSVMYKFDKARPKDTEHSSVCSIHNVCAPSKQDTHAPHRPKPTQVDA